MSDYTLKGLNNYQDQKIELKGLNLPQKKEPQEEEQLTSVSAFLDSLSISNIKSSTKIESIEPSNEKKVSSSSNTSVKRTIKQDLSILDQLMIPEDLPTKTIPQSYSHTSTPKTKQNVSDILSGIKPTKTSETITQKQSTQYKLEGLDISVSSTRSRVLTTSVDGTKTISKTYSVGAIISPKDVTSDKLNTAIEKIKNWDKKVGALDSELTKQKKGEGAGPDAIITRSQQVVNAKKEAAESRQDALVAYNSAITELRHLAATEQNNSKGQSYKTLYDEMEQKFAEVSKKDKTTWDKTLTYAKEAMSNEGFQRFVHILNPANMLN